MENQPIKSQIEQRVKDAMRSGDKPLLEVMRSMLSRISQKETADKSRRELTPDETNAVLKKMVTERLDVAKLFTENQRPELAEKETYQANIIQPYLLKEYDAAQVRALITEMIADGNTTIKDVMNQVRPYGALINGKIASDIAKELLATA